MKIYLAGSIFYHGDVLRNTEWAAKIRAAIPNIDLYSPIENTDINGTEGKKKFAGSQEIANGDNIRLNNTDILVACIDGDILPAGTCAEIGKFHEKIERGDHKYIVGICTDNRQMYLTHSEAKNAGGAASLGEQQYSYQNLYVTGLIKQGGILVSNIEDAIAFIKEKEPEFSEQNPIIYFDKNKLLKMTSKVQAYGKPRIYCNDLYASQMLNNVIYENEEWQEKGFIGKFYGIPVYKINSLFENNEQPQAMVVPILKEKYKDEN